MVSKSIHITTRSVDETQGLGQKIGEMINQPLTIFLIGDLGSGKTAFVQGLAIGLEVPQNYYITSPTFTLINEYPGRLPLLHVDLYRLDTIRDLEDIGLDDLPYDRAVLAVEWADKISDDFADQRLSLRIEIIDHDFRKIGLIASGQTGIDLLKALETHFNTLGVS